MRKLLNVLYITSPDSYLSKDDQNIVIYCKDQEKFRIPIHNVEGIVCFNYTGASPALMAMCAENGVGLTFLNEHDQFLARVTGGVKGNVLLRKKQYRISDNESLCVPIAANFIYGKILNCRSMLRRTIRDHGNTVDADKLERTSLYLLNSAKKILNTKTLDEIRGIEGDAAKIYFESFNEMILTQKDSFYMETRSKRPPKDNLNALLSFLYTILAHEVQSALETVGLDPYVGFLHSDRPGRASLALDLMEELRGPFADRLALTLINRKQINKTGFTLKENGSVLMDDKTKKEVLAAWHARKQEETTHPFLDEKISFGLVPYVQALLLSRFLREDIDGYPPFLLK
jgi:CRISPR-associated protein Cas1